MWSAFRVENEHVANVSAYRASRALPLPYAIHTDEELEDQRRSSGRANKTRGEQPKISEAHATDFSRKRRDESIMASTRDDDSDASDDDFAEGEAESVHEDHED